MTTPKTLKTYHVLHCGCSACEWDEVKTQPIPRETMHALIESTREKIYELCVEDLEEITSYDQLVECTVRI